MGIEIVNTKEVLGIAASELRLPEEVTGES